MSEPILIFGAGQLGKCVADAMLLTNPGKRIVFVDRGPSAGQTIIGMPVMDEAEVLASPGYSKAQVFVAVGDNWQRETVVGKVKSRLHAATFPTIIHPGAHISPFSQLAEGVVALAGCVVNPSASIGRHSVLWSNAIVEHDCMLAPFTTLSPAAALGGAVRIGERSFIGVGASIRHATSVGRDSIIAMGAAVVSDVGDAVVMAGTPARLLRNRTPEERYL